MSSRPTIQSLFLSTLKRINNLNQFFRTNSCPDTSLHTRGLFPQPVQSCRKGLNEDQFLVAAGWCVAPERESTPTLKPAGTDHLTLELPIKTPVMNTNAPPNATWVAAETMGVSI